jgi:hypothetical protein
MIPNTIDAVDTNQILGSIVVSTIVGVIKVVTNLNGRCVFLCHM